MLPGSRGTSEARVQGARQGATATRAFSSITAPCLTVVAIREQSLIRLGKGKGGEGDK